MDINAIIDVKTRKPDEILQSLRQKSVSVPDWGSVLEKAYNPLKHPVMDKLRYPDRVDDETGQVIPVTRITFDLQRLAAKRLTELCVGVPVKRVYEDVDDDPKHARLKQAADLMEKLYKRNRINSLNIERVRSLFAGCEVMTVWYVVQQDNTLYGVKSKLKLRSVTYSPMKGDRLYPLFDEYGDLIALSVQYKRKVGATSVSYFDCYTAERIIKFNTEEKNGWGLASDEVNAVGKIPAVYVYRETPAWEDNNNMVYEQEWEMSRNGNYLRENSRPVFVVTADEEIQFGNEPDANSADRSVLKYPKGSSAQYVTWTQATEALKFNVTELRQMYFTLLQLPDWSFDNMKAVPQSGESRKQMYVDAIMKVTDESGRLIEFFDREFNVIREFAKKIAPELSDALDELQCEMVITPCTLDAQEEDTDERAGEKKDGKNVAVDTKPAE